MDSLLRIKLANKYNLYHRQKVSFETLERIYTNENIEAEDLYRIFDVSTASKYKFRKKINCGCYITIYSQTEIDDFKENILNNDKKIFNEILKEKYRLTDKAIKEIKKGRNSKSTLKLDLDIKYIYGNMYINKKDIQRFEKLYNSDEEEIIKNIAKYKRIYRVYRHALENNKKGICILKDTRMSDKFFEENYEDLNRCLEIKANIKCSAYRCFDIKDDLKSEAYEQIFKDGGIYENNIKNVKLTISYLLNMVDVKMNTFINKRPRYSSLFYTIDGVTKEREIADDRYSPEKILMPEDS